MLRCQTIFDGDNGLTCVVGDPLQHRILHVCAAKYPTATMEMQIYPARLRRCDYAQGDLVAVLAGDGHGSRPFGEHGGGERTVTPPTRCPGRLSTNDPSFRLAGQQLNHLRVQVRSVGVDRRIVEHDGIERAYVCHRLCS